MHLRLILRTGGWRTDISSRLTEAVAWIEAERHSWSTIANVRSPPNIAATNGRAAG
ncbi:hypothetical protein MES5069_620166 [Mesorhizobium escarrei]|uniref:Uncharacterized protein n=1 Tax=Mesorhizobium escarrei TaxID=666018 RepID=A0ABN8KEM5_9HYPH|nr:hypothetical protein MES5069_620166 [Mesorhizobium escarrei]